MAAVDKSKNVAQRTKGKVKEAGWRHDPATTAYGGRARQTKQRATSSGLRSHCPIRPDPGGSGLTAARLPMTSPG